MLTLDEESPIGRGEVGRKRLLRAIGGCQLGKLYEVSADCLVDGPWDAVEIGMVLRPNHAQGFLVGTG